jgi:acetyl esterase/lipase
MSRDITSLPPIAADERVTFGTDPSQFFDGWVPRDAPARGAAIMIHGGFWRARYDLTHASHLCVALAANGIAVVSLEYRRVGDGGGWRGLMLRGDFWDGGRWFWGILRAGIWRSDLQ